MPLLYYLCSFTSCTDPMTTNGVPTGTLIYDHHSQLLNLHFKVSSSQIDTYRIVGKFGGGVF